MTISLLSTQIKSAITSNLIFLRALFMLVTWMLDSLTKLLALSVLIKMITYLHKGSLVVMLIWGLGLVTPLIIFWTCSIFLFWRLGKTSLIFRVSLTILVLIDFEAFKDTWAYDFLLTLDRGFFLKNLEISFAFLDDLARIGGES